MCRVLQRNRPTGAPCDLILKFMINHVKNMDILSEDARDDTFLSLLAPVVMLGCFRVGRSVREIEREETAVVLDRHARAGEAQQVPEENLVRGQDRPPQFLLQGLNDAHRA